ATADPRPASSDGPVTEQARGALSPPAALRRREEALPRVVEVEQAREQRGVPQERVERGDERDGRRRLRRRLQKRELLGDDEALAAHALDVDRHERTGLDQLFVQLLALRRVGDAVEGAAGAS